MCKTKPSFCFSCYIDILWVVSLVQSTGDMIHFVTS